MTRTLTDLSAHQVDGIARALAAVWPIQAVVTVVWLLVPHPADAHEAVLVALMLGGGGIYLTTLRRLRAAKLSRRSWNVCAVVGITWMSVLVWAGGGLASGMELIALWMLPFVVCMVPMRDVVATMGLIVVGCTTAAQIEFHPQDLLRKELWGFAVMGVATMIVNTSMVAYLYRTLRAANLDSERRSLHDPLTELPNGALLGKRLAEISAGADGAVYVLDVDGFKFVNDSLGHHAGDQLLSALAARLQRQMREHDLLARLGGDEFVVVAATVRDTAVAVALGERLVNVCADPFSLDGEEVDISITAGACLLADADSGELAMRNADLALYAAKGSRRSAVQMFEPTMAQTANTRTTLERHLRHALERDELRVVYQPVVSLPQGPVYGLEALLRWHCPPLGDVSPTEFIPIAERSGLILPIGRFVLARALEQLAAWLASGLDVRMSVNLSASQLADEQLPELLTDLLELHGIPGERVLLELTETALMERATTQPLGMLDRLRATGAGLVLDDFGTGYSSLARLGALALTAVKIDRSFVRRMGSDPGARAIVAAVLQMSGPLETAVVAEGVETEAERELLVEMRCPYAQGYLFGAPAAADQTTALLEADQARRLAADPA
ncbi:MAG: diguanylate cyclase [Solirubrobacteraceae bacterium]|jgi:diguanylate cyclase (GGDEF)-like protein|nr:diguanylate cyclase [Solirubrobacteraceae bacterium]